MGYPTAFHIPTLAACLLSLAGQATARPLNAPDPIEPAVQLPAASIAVTGREFGAARMPLKPISGSIEISAQIAQGWDEGTTQPTRRLLLRNDVQIRLGDFQFNAKRAAVWLQKISQSGDQSTYQVYAILEEVGGTTSASGPSMTGRQLPVRGVITTSNVVLKVDRLDQNRPEPASEFLIQSEAKFADVVRKISGVPTTDEVKDQIRTAEEARLLAERATRVAQGPARTPNLPPLPKEHPSITFAQATSKKIQEPDAGAESKAEASAKPETKPDSRQRPPQTRLDETKTADVTKPAPPVAPPATKPEPKPETKVVATVPDTKSPPPPATPTTQTPAVATNPAPSPTSTTTTPGRSTTATEPAPSPTTTATTAPQAAAAKATPADAPIFVKTGVVSISAKDLTIQGGKEENSIIASGGVTLQYVDATADRTLEMSAQRAVVFMDPAPLAQSGRIGADKVRGIYLEGAVSISDGHNNLRGQKMFYDLQKNKGIVLDATYWTYDQQRALPLYVRAAAVRQESRDTFTAEKANLSTTAFFDNDLSLGARSVTISRREPAGGAPSEEGATIIEKIAGTPLSESPSSVQAQMEGITVRAYDTPIAYFPSFTGDPGNMPIRDLRFEDSNSSGLAAKVRWNLYGLLGRKRPDEFHADIFTDYYASRGVGLGTNLSWSGKESEGSLFAYSLLNDHGTDVMKPGTKIERDGGMRGMITADNRWRIDDHWTLFTEAAYVGDPAFVDSMFELQQETRREFTTQMLATRREENTYLTAQAKGSFDDFVVNEYLLESQGYSVNKYPEVTYTRLNDDLAADSAPGLLTWTHEYRAGVVGMNFDKVYASERGFANNTLAQKAFGINGNQRIADRLRAEGLFQSNVFRADTRQELSSQLAMGPVMVTPFAVGRLTAYDTDFNSYAPNESDKTRLWGSVGMRVSTTIQRVDDSVHSQFFDLNQIRHIVEPGITIWTAGTNRDRTTLPVYDDAVENLADGSQVRVGVHQTWQTHRGSQDKYRSVDVFKLDLDYVDSSSDADRRSPLRRFYDPRPELSEVGQFFVTDASWQATDALAITGSNIYDFELHQVARTSVGFLLEQGRDFSTFAELRTINSQDSQFLDFGGSYKVTSKYSVGTLMSYDVKNDLFQTVTVNLQRQSTSVLFGFDLSYNAVTGSTGVGFLFRPVGTGGSGAGTRGLGGLPNNAYSR